MSGDIEARIAEVLRAHRIERCSEVSPTDAIQWGRCVGCDSPVSGTFPIAGMDWDRLANAIAADHLAAVLVKELGLKQERIVRTIKGEDSTRREHMSRYVADWSRDE